MEYVGGSEDAISGDMSSAEKSPSVELDGSVVELPGLAGRGLVRSAIVLNLVRVDMKGR